MTADGQALPLYLPPKPALVGNRKDSFAYITLRDRLPVIITKLIDRTHRRIDPNNDQDSDTDRLKAAIEQLAALRYQLQCNKPLRPLESIQNPSVDDLADWNKAVATEFGSESLLGWFDVPWLFAECYLYRRIRHIFDTCGLQNMDYFLADKQDSFGLAAADIKSACIRLDQLMQQNQLDLEVEFHEFLQNSLWGNQHDLSMDADRSAAEINSNRHSDKQHAADNYIIANDYDKLKTWIRQIPRDHLDSAGTLHIVLDNAGAELVMDLCLADWLQNRAKLFKKTIFHCKAIPWFVSDVLVTDIPWTLDAVENKLVGTPAVRLVSRWREMFQTDQWAIRADPCWTSYRPFDHLPLVGSPIISEIATSSRNLIIFKGDLNYRKLVYDCQWPFDTPFSTAVGERLSSALQNVPLVALRTCKSDVVSGVDAKMADRLNQEAGKNIGAKGWLVTGRYAVLQVLL